MSDGPFFPRSRRRQPAEVVLAQAQAREVRLRLEEVLAMHIKAFGLPVPERQYRFHPTRLWTLDFAWPSWKLAVEIEGLVPAYMGAPGRHQMTKGYEKDLEKHNALAEAGWKLLRFTRNQISSGGAIRCLENVLRP